jgi:hypothetical protein
LNSKLQSTVKEEKGQLYGFMIVVQMNMKDSWAFFLSMDGIM